MIMADYSGLYVIMADYQVVVADYWIVVADYWMVMAGCGWSLVITGWLRVIPVFSTITQAASQADKGPNTRCNLYHTIPLYYYSKNKEMIYIRISELS